MTETRQDNGWWADDEMIFNADGVAIAECYWLPIKRADVDARERAQRIARLPELEEATGALLDILADIFSNSGIMTEEDGDDWPELRQALARVSALLFPEEPEDEVE